MKSIAILIPICFLFSSIHAQWEPERLLAGTDSSIHTSFNNARSIAVGPPGVIHVTWYDHRTGKDQVRYTRSTDEGNTWSVDTQLSHATTYAQDPCIAVSDSLAVIVWDDARDGQPDKVYYVRSTDAGATWSRESLLAFQLRYSRDPSVAINGQNVHVAWADDRDSSPEIYYKRSTDGGVTWGPDTRLTYAPQESWYPSIAVSDSCVHVAWRDWRDHDFQVYYKRSTDNGTTWSADQRLSAQPGSYNPSVSVSGPFVHVIYWAMATASAPDLFYRRSTDSGATWSSELNLTQDSSGSYNPSIAARGDRVHVVWEALANYTPVINYKVSTDDGVDWSPATRLGGDSSNSVAPFIADDSPSLHVVWTEFRFSPNGAIFYKRNMSGVTGIAENPKAGSRGLETRNLNKGGGIFVTPDPFATYAHVAGHERDMFRILDASGRDVGTFHGDRIGAGLAPGVYFVQVQGKVTEPVRVVKLR